jgi:hypothetical protein
MRYCTLKTLRNRSLPANLVTSVVERLLSCSVSVGFGSGVRLEQLKFTGENRPLNFSDPEADLAQFVLPATSRL